MFNKFKSAFYNVVGSFDPTEGGAVGNFQSTLKFPYSRPQFLQFSTEDEILVTADHAIRPIICPRDISRLPWNSGYAETINAGKSKRNEDQSAIHAGILTRCVTRTIPDPPVKTRESEINKLDDSGSKISQEFLANPKLRRQQFMVSLPYHYFGVFDGHAGWGAAVAAANQLYHVIHEKLCEVIDFIIPDIDGEDQMSELKGPFWSIEKKVTPESAVIGALEQAFWTMDQHIAEDRLKYQLSGGCTACVALFILGKVFVTNAGDSRATIAFNGVPVPMSFDFTPESESQRIRKLGARHPELLGREFTHLEYLRRPLKQDLGKKAAYRDHYMKGWAVKTITDDDLRYPLICGEGKRSRVLATIGVTRGFGDHDLKAQFSGLLIKPFLSPEPEVKVFDLSEVVVSDRDVLILGTDGLWDITSNEKAVNVACQSLAQFPLEDPHKYKYRYTSAAHDLVLQARGRLKEHSWRTVEEKHATIDDISVFVIPMKAYKEEYEDWQKEAQNASMSYISEESSEIEAAIDVVRNGPETAECNNSPMDIEEDSHPLAPQKDNDISLTNDNGAIGDDDDTKSTTNCPSDELLQEEEPSSSQIAPVDDYFEDCDDKNSSSNIT